MIDRIAIGVDLGGTKIATALVHESGQVLKSTKIDTNPEAGKDEVLDRMAAQINSLIADIDKPVSGVGIGSPGFIKFESGLVIDAVNLGWKNVQLSEEIHKRLRVDIPIHLLIDTNASALGELYFGAGQAYHDFIYVSIGTGLGAGVVVNKKPVIGANGLVGFIGHFSQNPMGARCACGLRDCPEMVVSGEGMAKLVRGKLKAGAKSDFFADSDKVGSHNILAALEANEPVAVVAFDQMVEVLADVLSSGIAWLNPQALIIGGGIGLASFDRLKPLLTQKLNRRLHAQNLEGLDIVPSVLKSSAVGAACLVFQGV